MFSDHGAVLGFTRNIASRSMAGWAWILAGAVSLGVILALALTGVQFGAGDGRGGGIRAASPASLPEPPVVTAFQSNQAESVPQAGRTGLPAIVDAHELFVVDASGGEPRLIHSAAGYTQRPVWSPDGSKLAFGVQRSADKSKVYVVDGTTAQVLVAADVEGSVGETLWSPTGEQLAIGTMGLRVFSDEAPPSFKILAIGLDGNAPRELYSEVTPARLLSWLAGGSRLLAVVGSDLVADDAARSSWRRGDLVSIDAATAELSVVIPGVGDVSGPMALSPDRSRVAVSVPVQGDQCVGPRPPASLVIASVADGTKREAVGGLCESVGAAWSPDGREIAYVFGAPRMVHLLDVDSGQSRRLKKLESGLYGGVEWLPDGSGLVVELGYGEGYQIVFVPLDGRDEQVLAVNYIFTEFGGFAPDARRYAYSDDAVRVGTLEGPAIALTAPDPESAYRGLRWAPGGDRVAYIRTPNDTVRRYAVNVQTGEVTKLAVPKNPVTLSPDRRLHAFISEATAELWVSNADGTDGRPLAQTVPGGFVWSPGSDRIAYTTAGEAGTELHVVEVAGGEAQRLATFDTRHQVSSWSPRVSSWSPDGSRILVVSGPWAERLAMVEVATGRSSWLTPLPDWRGPWSWDDPRWSPDGTTLAFEVRDESGILDVWVVNVESGQFQQLTNTPFMEFDPSWSPDSGQIAFWRDLERWVTSLYVVSVATGEERELARFRVSGGSAGNYPAWSPDGQWVAVFVQSREEPGIHVARRDGSQTTYVVAGRFGGRGFLDIAWDADSQQITFKTQHQGL